MNTLSFTWPFYSAYLQRAVVYFLAIFAVISCVFLVFSYSQHRVDTHNLVNSEKQLLRKSSATLISDLTPHANNLQALLNSPAFRQYLASNNGNLLDQVNNKFESLVKNSPNYTSIQYIDNFGQIKIRTVSTESYPDSSYQLIAALDDVQRLSQQNTASKTFYLSPTFYSFKEKLEGSETIIQIMVPIMFDQNFYGLLALDVLATDIFSRYQKSLSTSMGTPMLVNNRGHIIFLAKNSGQQYASSEILNLSQFEPTVWQNISPALSGDVTSDSGLYMFNRIRENTNEDPQAYGGWLNINFINDGKLRFTPFTKLEEHPTYFFAVLAFSLVFSIILASIRTRLQWNILQLNHKQYLANTGQQVSHLGTWIWHSETGEMEWSDEMFRILDLPPQKFSPNFNNYMEFLHPEDREKFSSEFKEVCFSSPGALFHRIRDNSGNIRQVCLRTSGQTYFENAQLDLIGTIQDITELKDEFMHEFETTNRHGKIVESMQDAYILLKAIRDQRGKVIDFLYLEVNAAFEDAMNLKRTDIIHRTILELFPATEAIWIDSLSEIVDKGSRKNITHYSNVFDKTFELTAFPVRQDQVAGFFKDVTQKMLSETQLQEASKVFEGTSEAIIICDEHGVIVQVNTAFENITGYSAKEVCGHSCTKLRCYRHDETFYQSIDEQLKKTGSWNGEMWNRRKNGELYPTWVNISTILDEKQQVISYIQLISDISPVKEAEERLNYIAHHDILTGLANRLAFSANVAQALENANRHKNKIAMFYLDLDDFKEINDAMGHGAGDQCLRIVANRIANCVRANDCVARLGGDEFAIILEDLYEPEDLSNLAKKIINSVSDPIYYGGEEIFVSTSIGISIYPDDCSTADELTQTADTAMYKVKARNPGSFEYYSGMVGITAYQNKKMENHLRRALGNSELKLFYQPQIQVNSGKIRGVEALLRWQHPTQGLIMPDKILAYAKSAQLIKPLGDWVINEVCRQVKLWKEANLPKIHISVNLSLHQFLRNHIVETLQNALQKHNITMNDFTLELEITEEIMHSNYGVQTTLSELQQMGVSIALENFGNILTSLRELKELPINTLKVDAKFLETLSEKGEGAKNSITSAIVTTGHALGMRVVATCVETELQLQHLSAMGCDDVQGFLFSKAVSNDDIHPMLKEA